MSSQGTSCRTRVTSSGDWMKALSTPAAMASIHRAEFGLGGLFKFHCVSLCGSLYPLPRRTTFCFRDALHLVEACNSVAYVRNIFSGSLRCFGKANLVADIRSRAGLVSFAILFLPRSSLRMGGPGIVLTFDYGSFSSYCRVAWLSLVPSGFGHARLTYFFLTRVTLHMRHLAGQGKLPSRSN